jgi:DNA-binding response OmpR family regulator
MKIEEIVLIDDDADEYMLFADAIASIDKSIHTRHVSRPLTDHESANCVLPQLVFLDINMPHMNGFEWLSWFKQKNYGFPVIMYSTSKSKEKIELSYQLGANLYLTKPLDFKEMIQSLQSIINLDWTQPEEIRKSYYTSGFCKSFSLS